MAVPLPVPAQQQTNRPNMIGRSPMSGANLGLYSPLSSSINMTSPCGNSCALTILKGDADHPIHPHAPIHQKQDASRAPNRPQQQSRFATSFANLRSASKSASSGFDSSVNVHAISDAGILLPFLDRPSEVKELLFHTKANEALMYRLCRLFGGDPERPTSRGVDERWDEMLELLIELDRPLLDDEDWLVRLESLVMERSPELWAQLARCLGAEGLTLRPAAGQPSSSRFDSWALPSTRRVNASHLNDSPLSPPSASSSEDGDARYTDRSMSMSVEPLDALPQSYSEQPAGKMHKSTLRESVSPASSPISLAPEPASRRSSGQASPAEVFAMSAGGDDPAFPASLEDIMEEPGSSAERLIPRRARSHSGKYAGLRISAMTTSSPASDSLGASIRRDSSSSPLPAGDMVPPAGLDSSREQSPNRTSSTSFSKHRRLSVLVKQNNLAETHLHRDHDKSDSAAASPRSASLRRQRGASEAGQSLSNYSFPSQPRRRAQSFARSFAELKSPSEHLEQLRADNAKAEADRLAENTRRMSLKDTQSGAAASAPSASSGGLGLHRDSCSSSGLLDPASALGAKVRRASVGRKLSASKGDGSSSGSTSPSIPGLLPDGRTRHPSGSFGSRDLSESIAAFRANMGLSISPSPSENNFSEAGASETGSAPRKRKGSGGAELPKPTSRTANTAEAKISRKGSPPTTSSEKQNQAQFEQPKHMQDIQSRQKAAGSSGSGLALGGGFSLAKSGANFRRQSREGTPRSPTGWKSNFSRRDGTRTRGDPYSFRSPPAVHRRPGGFASLAQEYEKARHGRRTSESVFSISSNALESSPSSSIASFDAPGEGISPAHRLTSDDSVPHLSLTSDAGESMLRNAATPGDPTPTAGPGDGPTPRPSFTRLASGSQGYPFPNLLHRMASVQDAKSQSSGPATPLSPLQACRTRLSPSPNVSGLPAAAGNGPKSPSIVFPISPSPNVSRAKEFQKAINTAPCQQAFERIKQVSGDDAAKEIKELITTTERSHLHDEALLEQVGKRLGLVDHERARQAGGQDAENADIALAEEGYQQRWDCFADLCRSLGVGQYELGLAKRRCGPAIDLCG